MSDETAASEVDDESDLWGYLAQFSDGTHQYVLSRYSPGSFVIGGRPRKTEGHLETFQQPPTLEAIRETYGGGNYEIRVMGPMKGQKGHRILGSRRFAIAGDPKLKPDSLVIDESPPPPPEESPRVDDEVYREMIDELRVDRRRLEESLEKERERRRDASAQLHGLEARLAAIEAHGKSASDAHARELARRDEEITLIRKQFEARPALLTDGDLLKLAFGRSSEDSQRLLDAHRAELTAERDRWAREVAAGNERARQESEALRRQHEHTMQMVDRLHQSQLDGTRASHDQFVAAKNEEVARLNEQLRELRAVKERTILDEVERVTELKGMLDGLGGGAAGASEGGFDWKKLFDPDNPVATGLGNFLAGIGQFTARQAASPNPAQPRPVGVPYVRYAPPGYPIPQQPWAWAPVGAAAPVDPRVPPAPQAAPPPPPSVDVATAGAALAEALTFVEAAYHNRVALPTVASSIRSQFPRVLVEQLVALGANCIVAEIEKLRPDSLLASPGGRRFLVDLFEAVKSAAT